MPGTGPGAEDTDTQMIADMRRQLARQQKRNGFNVNADPVVIGLRADGGGAVGGVAIGRDATIDTVGGTVDCHSSVVIGDDAQALAFDAVVFGHSAIVDTGCTSAVSIGANAEAHQVNSVVIGKNAYCDTGGGSVVIGLDATAQGDSAVSILGHAIATKAVALGSGSDSQYVHSTAVGPDSQTDRDHQVMLGDGTDVVDVPGNGNGVALLSPGGTRYLFTVSNGGALVITATP